MLWLLTPDATGQAGRALFASPAARLLVHARGDRKQQLRPWLNESENRNAILSVYATVARLDQRTRELSLDPWTGLVDSTGNGSEMK